jgi:cell division septum initiation protein DivIVA
LEREDFETMLDTQLALATDVNSDVIGETPGPFIPWLMAEVDLETEANQLQFIGRGFTQAEADALAESMQKNFLAVSTVGAGLDGMREDLQQTATDIQALRDEIGALQALTPPTQEEVDQASRRTVLENQVSALQAHLGTLTTQLMNPELVLRTPESIQAEMDRTLVRLTELQNELAGFPPIVDPATLDQQDPVLTMKQLELQQLETRWNNLFSGILEQEALARSSSVDSRPVTLDAASTTNNQMLATIGAVAAALIGLVAIERGRGMMWSQKDLDEGPPVIVELPSRPLAVFHHPRRQGEGARQPSRCCAASWTTMTTPLSPSRGAGCSGRTSGSSPPISQWPWLSRGGAFSCWTQPSTGPTTWRSGGPSPGPPCPICSAGRPASVKS